MIAHLLIACGVIAVLIIYGEIRYECGYQRRIADRAQFDKLMNAALVRSIDMAEADIAARALIAQLEHHG